MFLARVGIRNFRGIKDLDIDLDDVCVLIGENNSGKSSVLDAIHLCLSSPATRRSGVFQDYDHHLPDSSREPPATDPIEITLHFAERRDEKWPEKLNQQLGNASLIDSNGRRYVALRVSSRFDQADWDFNTEYEFLDQNGQALTEVQNSIYIESLRQFVPAFHLASLRDAAKEFTASADFWSHFVRSLEIDNEERTRLEVALADLNREILDKHAALQTVKERLQEIAKHLPPGDDNPVGIEAVPSRVFDILSRTQVSLASRTGAYIPIARHGSGTQSLAVISLFDAFLRSRLERAYGEHAEPMLTLEEPEAHLHPSAIKSVAKLLHGLSGQKIVSTHSGELLAAVPLSQIRRLRRKDGKVTIHRLDDSQFAKDDISKLDYKVRSTRGSLMFSRCWLLVEGETEARLLPECASAMGFDLLSEGVSCIEFTHVGIERLIKLANQFGIDWVALADGDRQGQGYLRSARQHLHDGNESDHLWSLPDTNTEVYLCLRGFGDIYEENVPDQNRSKITAAPGTPEYWHEVTTLSGKAKTRCAFDVAQRIASGSAEVPDFLQHLLETAIRHARRSA